MKPTVRFKLTTNAGEIKAWAYSHYKIAIYNYLDDLLGGNWYSRGTKPHLSSEGERFFVIVDIDDPRGVCLRCFTPVWEASISKKNFPITLYLEPFDEIALARLIPAVIIGKIEVVSL